MIQRVQTLFLLFAIIALGLFLWFPLIALESPRFKDAISGWEIAHTLPVLEQPYIIFFNAIFSGTAIGLSLVNIFLYKNRSLQMMFCWFTILMILTAEGFVFFKYETKIFMGDVILTPWNLLAVAAILLQLLAFIFVRKDEELVKSLDRLR